MKPILKVREYTNGIYYCGDEQNNSIAFRDSQKADFEARYDIKYLRTIGITQVIDEYFPLFYRGSIQAPMYGANVRILQKYLNVKKNAQIPESGIFDSMTYSNAFKFLGKKEFYEADIANLKSQMTTTTPITVSPIAAKTVTGIGGTLPTYLPKIGTQTTTNSTTNTTSGTTSNANIGIKTQGYDVESGMNEAFLHEIEFTAPREESVGYKSLGMFDFSASKNLLGSTGGGFQGYKAGDSPLPQNTQTPTDNSKMIIIIVASVIGVSLLGFVVWKMTSKK